MASRTQNPAFNVLHSRFRLLVLCTFLPALGSAAVWTTDGTDSLLAAIERIEFNNVTISSNGTITLAPELVEKAATGDNSVWSVCPDKSGNIYFGTGPNARLYRLGRGQAQPELLHDGGTGELLAITADPRGTIYFAVTPEARIYRLRPGGRPEPFFDTKEKYLSSLLCGPDGTLYCATGPNGKLYRIAPDSRGVEIFAAPQANISTLAWLAVGRTLLAGTSPDGIVYRLELETDQPRPQVTVLYDTPENEVRSLVVAGDIYIGTNPGSDGTGDTSRPRVYRTSPDGTLRWVWTAPETTLFALAPRQNSLLVATGNRGIIYQLDTLGRLSVWHRSQNRQVLALAVTAQGCWLGTGTSGRLYLAGANPARSGQLSSAPFDCQNPARFGRLDFRGQVPAGTSLSFETRSGNSAAPDSTWNPWQPVQGRVAAAPARFLQWRALLATEFPDRTPLLSRVDIYYEIANRAPAIRKLEVAPLTAVDARKGVARPTRTVTWEATDPDSDSLSYRLYFRAEGDKNWQPVSREITEPRFELDTRAIADGWYELRLTASDAPDRPRQSAQTSEFISRPFLVDNTAPVISDLRATRKPSAGQESTITLSFSATDALSVIAACRVTTNVGEWQPIMPADTIFDSSTERFETTLQLGPEASTIAVWVADAQGNVGTARIRVP